MNGRLGGWMSNKRQRQGLELKPRIKLGLKSRLIEREKYTFFVSKKKEETGKKNSLTREENNNNTRAQTNKQTNKQMRTQKK